MVRANKERSGRFLRPESRSLEGRTRALGVLVVEEQPELQWRLTRTLTIDGYRVVGTSSAAGALALLEHWSVDVAIIDEHIWSAQGSELLAQRLRRLRQELPLVLLASGNRSVDTTTIACATVHGPTANENGEKTVILRPPIQPENVRAALRRALNSRDHELGLLTTAPAG